MASRGYAHNQYNKMELFEDQGVKGNLRTAKFAVAYCRALWQCAEFLTTGEFKCQIEEPMKSFLFDVKTNYKSAMVPYLTEMFMTLQADVTKAWKRAEKLMPDIAWIEDFILRSYSNRTSTVS